MSKIQPVNYQNQPKLTQKHANYAAMQSFGEGLSDLLPETQRVLKSEFEAQIDKKTILGKRIKQLADYKGEIQSQLINAIFTTTLAPFWIMHGPFPGDKSEKDKAYLAWRQPISAAIALGLTLPITTGINRVMDTWYNEGHIKAIDLSAKPNSSYIKRFYKKVAKESRFSRLKMFLLARTNFEFEDYKENVEKQRLELFSRLMTEEHPKNIRVDDSPLKLQDPGLDLQKTKEGEDHHIKLRNLTTQPELEEYLNKNNFYKCSFKDFMQRRFGFEFHGEQDGDLAGKMKLDAINTRLNDIKAMDFLTEIGLIEEGKVDADELRRILLVYKQAQNNPTIRKEVYNEGILRDHGAKILQDLTGINATRTAQLTKGEKVGEPIPITLEQFFHQLGYYKDKKETTGKTLQELMDRPMAEVLNELASHFKKFKMKGFNPDAGLADFAKNMIKRNAKRMTENAKNHKFYAGIGFNLITTLISCSVLNWVYPRFMAKFLPNLVKKSEVKGGNK